MLPENIGNDEFNNLLDEIKNVNIGQKLMQHMLECEECKNKSIELNHLAVKHIAELEKLT